MREIHRAQFSEYTPHEHAVPFHNSRALERLLIAPTRSGKTFSLIFDIIRAAWNNPFAGFATLVTAPEYKQLGPLLERPITQRLIGMGLMDPRGHSFTDHHSVLKRGQEILYRSLENYEAIEGLNCGPIYIDEAGLARVEAIDTVRQRALTLNSPITMATTPKGTGNWMYKQYFGPDAKPHANTQFFRYEIFDNPLITQEAVDRLKADLDPIRVRQEIYAEWVNLTEDRVYYAFDDEKNVREYDPINDIVYVCLDYNIGINAWCAIQINMRTNTSHVFAEGHGAKTTKAVGEQILAEFGPEVMIIDDASGNIRQQGDMHTQRQILNQCGLHRIAASTSNPLREKRYAVVNAHFENGLGNRHLFVSPRCKRLRNELNNLCYKPNSDKPDDENGKSGHITDALGYGVYYLSGGQAGWDRKLLAA